MNYLKNSWTNLKTSLAGLKQRFLGLINHKASETKAAVAVVVDKVEAAPAVVIDAAAQEVDKAL